MSDREFSRVRGTAARQTAGADRGGEGGEEVAAHLRARMLGEIHAGRLQAGDRMPSIREIAGALGVTNWTVSHAYRVLAREGLVERRARSGVYVAALDRRRDAPAPETAGWMAEVLTQASEHLIRIPLLPDLVRRYTATVRFRCACVESDLDSLTALSAEAALQFGLDSFPVPARRLRKGDGATGLPSDLREADLLLTTAFHAPSLLAAAEALDKPLVVATLDPEAIATIERHTSREGRLTLVCADPRFAERMREVLPPATSERVRFVLAEDAEAVARLDPAEAILLTRAAGQQLEGMTLRLLLPRFPSFSRQFSRALAEVLIGLNLGTKAP